MNAQTQQNYIVQELFYDLKDLLDNNKISQAGKLLEEHPEIREHYKTHFAIN